MTRHRSQLLAATAAALIASTAIAACGSSSPRSASASGSSGPSGHPSQAQINQAQNDAVRFVSCLRSHHVTNVPDPTASSGRGFKDVMASALQTPAGQAAYTACHHLLPGGGPSSESPAQPRAQTAALLAFARCLRSHGFTRFPDPTSSGQLTHQMVVNAGINLQQPAVLQAGDACVGATHGVITRAMVARFAAGQ